MATSLFVVAPVAMRAMGIPHRSIETRVVDATDSFANIPTNLLDGLANIPYNEVQALDAMAGSMFVTGSWWVPSASNLWGFDPGDPTHVASLTDLVAPFPALDGGVGGLQYQLDGLLAAELPVSASCDAETCAPFLPPEVITGNTIWDRIIGALDVVSGQKPFGLFDNWFTVPLSTLASGYTFNSTNDPGVIDPSGPAYADPAFGFTNSDPNPFVGSTIPVAGSDGQIENTMRWDGLTYTLNPLQPIENYYNSLLAAPPTDGIAGTGIELPTLTEITQVLQALAAGLVIDFDPWVKGSPICLATCDIPASLTVQGLVQDINNLAPGGNPMINAWLADVAAGTVNNATPTQSQLSTDLWQTGLWNLTPTQLAQTIAELDSINPELGQLVVNAGILTDPGYLSGGPAQLGGVDPILVPADLLQMLSDSTNFSQLFDPSVLSSLLGLGL